MTKNRRKLEEFDEVYMFPKKILYQILGTAISSITNNIQFHNPLLFICS